MPNLELFRLAAAVRPNYFTGRLLTAEDFQAEQDYQRGQRWLHNRLLHGAGVVTGLAVTVSGGSVHVTPGVALDCLGREIVVPHADTLALPNKGVRLYLCVAYAERGSEPLPQPPDASPFEVEANYRLIEETYTLAWCGVPDRHARFGGGWLACGGEHGLPLARLVRSRGRWQRDTTYRRPAVV
jgi:hypothetical protein